MFDPTNCGYYSLGATLWTRGNNLSASVCPQFTVFITIVFLQYNTAVINCPDTDYYAISMEPAINI